MKWYFKISVDPIENVDLFPKRFLNALCNHLTISAIHLNTTDDEGWILTAYHQRTGFRIKCRNQLIDDRAEYVLWCEGFRRVFLNILKKTSPPPPIVVNVIPRILTGDLNIEDLKKLPD